MRAADFTGEEEEAVSFLCLLVVGLGVTLSQDMVPAVSGVNALDLEDFRAAGDAMSRLAATTDEIERIIDADS